MGPIEEMRGIFNGVMSEPKAGRNQDRIHLLVQYWRERRGRQRLTIHSATDG